MIIFKTAGLFWSINLKGTDTDPVQSQNFGLRIGLSGWDEWG